MRTMVLQRLTQLARGCLVLVLLWSSTACREGSSGKYVTQRTVFGPALDLTRPGETEWTCDFAPLGKDEFDAEFVLETGVGSPPADYIGSGRSPLRIRIEVFEANTGSSTLATSPTSVVRPFDDAERLTTDGYRTVLHRFVGGGSRSVRFKIGVETPDPAVAAGSPQLIVRPFYLAK